MKRSALFASPFLFAALFAFSACGTDNYIAGERLTDQCVSYCAARVTCDTERALPQNYGVNCQADCAQGELNDDAVDLSPEMLGCALHYGLVSKDEKEDQGCGSFRNCVKIGGYRNKDDDGN